MRENNQERFKDTIIVDNGLSDSSDNVITINSSYLNVKGLDDNHSYKVSPDGKVIFNDLLSNLKDEKLKELLTNELMKYGFEEIPADLNETQLKGILEFSIAKIEKGIEYGQFYPFSVGRTDDSGLAIILLMYNGNSLPFAVETFPIKLKDADDKVIFADLVNLNKAVSPKKTGIYYIKITKEVLKEDNMDLSTWSITFDVD